MRTITLALLLVLPSAAIGADFRFGDWIVSLDSDFKETFTANDSGSSVGVLCAATTQRCLVYLRTNTTCSVGDKQVALVNASAGAFSIQMECSQLQFDSGPEFVNFLGEYDTMRDALFKSNDIGIALPMTSGHFKVVRFSLKGSNQAIEAVEKSASSSKSKYQDSFQ